MSLNPDSRVVVALDFESGHAAMSLVGQLGQAASFYKVGLQLLTAEGPSVVRQLVASGKSVFLDLKLFEIPTSVAGAVRAAGQLGVSIVTVHASGGSAVLRAAVEAARPFPQLKVLALTVITSMQAQDLQEVGVGVNSRVPCRHDCRSRHRSRWQGRPAGRRPARGRGSDRALRR